jgi:hypothetical protein
MNDVFAEARRPRLPCRDGVAGPHAANVESLDARLEPLHSRFVCDPAVLPAEMRAAGDLVHDEFLRRKTQRRPGAPWLFICDEFSAMHLPAHP